MLTAPDQNKAHFVERLGNVFEHSPWVAEGAWAARPFETVEWLHRAMVAVVEEAGGAKQLELIRAHPDLAGKAARAGSLTAASSQRASGRRLGPSERRGVPALSHAE